jgi:hypothetical protein
VVWGANQAVGNPQPGSSCPSAGFLSCPAWFTRIFALTGSAAVLGTLSRDTTPPRLRVAVRRRQRLRRVLRHRLRFRVRASERARIFSRVVIGRRTAIRLHLISRRSHRRRVTVGRRRSFLVRAHRRTRVRIRFSRRARRHMRRAHRRFAVQLRVRARDGAGNYSRLVKRRVVLIP